MVGPHVKVLPLVLAQVDLGLLPLNTNLNEIHEAFSLFHWDLLRIIKNLPDDVLLSDNPQDLFPVILQQLVKDRCLGNANTLKTAEELAAEIAAATQDLLANHASSPAVDIARLMAHPRIGAGFEAAVNQIMEALKVIIHEIAKAFKISDYSGFEKLFNSISPAIIPLANESLAKAGITLELLINSVLNVETGRIDENLAATEKISTPPSGAQGKGKAKTKFGSWSRNTIVIVASVSVSIAMIAACAVVYLKF